MTENHQIPVRFRTSAHSSLRSSVRAAILGMLLFKENKAGKVIPCYDTALRHSLLRAYLAKKLLLGIETQPVAEPDQYFLPQAPIFDVA